MYNTHKRERIGFFFDVCKQKHDVCRLLNWGWVGLEWNIHIKHQNHKRHFYWSIKMTPLFFVWTRRWKIWWWKSTHENPSFFSNPEIKYDFTDELHFFFSVNKWSKPLCAVHKEIWFMRISCVCWHNSKMNVHCGNEMVFSTNLFYEQHWSPETIVHSLINLNSKRPWMCTMCKEVSTFQT